MAMYKCTICGRVFDESEADLDASGNICCPICGTELPELELIESTSNAADPAPAPTASTPTAPVAAESANGSDEASSLAYPAAFARSDPSCRHMDDIHRMAVTGESIIECMATRLPVPGWDEILLLGAQLNPPPLDADANVDTETVIGRNAKKPLVIQNPVYISHMSFGALSREAKVALAEGSAMAKTAMCSGEGGILPEEKAAAHKYIFEYVPNLYSVTPENLKEADAIEIKIGQGTKPGMGGHLPGGKVTADIAAVRGKPEGMDIISPSKFPGIDSKEDLKALVDKLRDESEGRPIGIKIAAGKIERDLEYCLFAAPDFITVDGRGGATGASPKFLRDATSLPTIYALHRARTYLDAHGSDISLVITGGLRVSSDFAKAIAMGADAVAIATAGLMALACQQYRICGSDKCPVGVATQDEALRAGFRPKAAALRVANFLNVTLEELKTFARVTGHSRLRDLSTNDLATTSGEIAAHAGIAHA